METYTFSEFSFKILTFKIRLLETEIIIDLYDRDRGTEGPRENFFIADSESLCHESSRNAIKFF